MSRTPRFSRGAGGVLVTNAGAPGTRGARCLLLCWPVRPCLTGSHQGVGWGHQGGEAGTTGGRLGPWWLCLLLTRPANPQCLAWLRGLRVGPSLPLLSCSRPGWHWDSVTTQRGLPRGTQCWTAPECRGGVCLTHVGDLRPCHSGRTRSPGPIVQTTHWSPEKGSDRSGQVLRLRRPHSSQAWARVWGPLRGSLLFPLRLVFSAQKLGWDQGLPLPP